MVRAMLWISALGLCAVLAVMACNRRQERVPVVWEGILMDWETETSQGGTNAAATRRSSPGPGQTTARPRAPASECQDPAALARWIVQQWGHGSYEGVRRHLLALESRLKQGPFRGRWSIVRKWKQALQRYGTYRAVGAARLLNKYDIMVTVELSRQVVEVFFKINSRQYTASSGHKIRCARVVSRWNLYVRPHRVPRQELRQLVQLLARGQFEAAARKYYHYPKGHMLVSVGYRHLRARWQRLVRHKGRFMRVLRVHDAERDPGGRPTVVVTCAFERGIVKLRFPPPQGRSSQSFVWGLLEQPRSATREQPRSATRP